MVKVPRRTPSQNAALHVYFERLATALNEAGYDMRSVVTMPILATPENVKEEMFKPVMRAMYPEKTSTADLSTVELQNAYEVMNLATAERLGISIPWPCKENMGQMWVN